MAIVVFLVQEEVLGLNITMADGVSVQVAQGVESLFHDRTSLSFGQVLFLSYVVKQLTTLAKPKNESEIGLNLLSHEETNSIGLPRLKKLYNIRMI